MELPSSLKSEVGTPTLGSRPLSLVRRFVIPLALSIAALAVAIVIASGSSSSELRRPSLDKALALSFQIFRSPTETLPQVAAHRISKALDDTYNANRASNSQLATTKEGPLWVFHAARFVCISHARGMACDRVRRAMREGVSLGVFDPPDAHRRGMHNFLVQGIVPNDVKQVLVVINNRRQLTLDVNANVFSIAADRPIHVKRLLRD